jgi:hypothetical protein
VSRKGGVIKPMRKSDGRVYGGSNAEVSGVGEVGDERGVPGLRRDKSSLIAMSRMKERRGRSLED